MVAMSATRTKTVYQCTSCGTPHPRWAGRCVGCEAWNTLVEELVSSSPPSAAARTQHDPVPIADVDVDAARPVPTALSELDRVLGGGLVAGSVTLLGGEPGVGKSTLVLQLLARRPGDRLYVTAEESAQQVRQRAERLGAVVPRLALLAETSLPVVLDAIERTRPTLVVVDSVQTLADPELGSPPGSVAQVRHAAHRLVGLAKATGTAVVIVGHVTKDGALAGPRVVEHVVDTVLLFEGDRHHALRLLRATKHRFGATNELGVFEMASGGLVAVDDPSALFLADRGGGLPGSVVVPTTEGRRPIVVELQALTTPTVPNVPARRSAQGLDGGRLSMLMAVLGRRTPLEVERHDVYASTAGGARPSEPAVDLGICLAVASAVLDVALPDGLAVFGEVGLGGELRQVTHADRRLAETARLGFTTVLVPANTPVPRGNDLHVVRVATLSEALAAADLLCRRVA